MDKVVVAGVSLDLTLKTRDELKLWVEAYLSYSFYLVNYAGSEFFLLKAKREGRRTPMQLQQYAARLQRELKLPIVFLLDDMPFYERNRLIERGVFFIVSNKYAFLPTLLINAKGRLALPKRQLTDVAQYMLLYHLQVQSLNDYTITALEHVLHLKYVTLTRAVNLLEQLGLCTFYLDDTRRKYLHFDGDKKALFYRALPYMRSPIQQVYYCDSLPIQAHIAGINALAHYSALNPDHQEIYALSKEVFKQLLETHAQLPINKIEGRVRIEVWNYPPIGDQGVVDRLSLFLTLADDKDPRVEKELEKMMNNIWL